MAFAVTMADMVLRYDERTLGDVVSADGTRLVGTQLTESTNGATAIASALGLVKMSLFRGNRYTETDLDDLPAADAACLTDLVCSVAWWYLWRRKPATASAQPIREEARKLYEDILKMLREGELVLNVDEAKDAGVSEGKAVDAVTVTNWQMITDRARPRFYPARRTPL